MTETSEQIKARARALRNKPKTTDNNSKSGNDEFSRRGQKSAKPKTGVKSNFRKPSV